MGLPPFDVQGSLFEGLGSIAPARFGDQDKYQLLAKKIWPVLARCCQQLAECYVGDNGRPGVEPVVLLRCYTISHRSYAPWGCVTACRIKLVMA
jgi:hypothetical protein